LTIYSKESIRKRSVKRTPDFRLLLSMFFTRENRIPYGNNPVSKIAEKHVYFWHSTVFWSAVLTENALLQTVFSAILLTGKHKRQEEFGIRNQQNLYKKQKYYIQISSNSLW